jgi:hypothetical protein
MNDKVKKEVEKLIKELSLNCSVKEFKDKHKNHIHHIIEELSNKL